MRKYFENVLVYGSAIVGFITFFKNDFPPLWQKAYDISGRSILLIICIVAFVIGLIMKVSEKRITLQNIRWKVRDWLDAFQIQVGRLEIPSSHFAWRATLSSGLEV